MPLIFQEELLIGAGAKPQLAHEPTNDLWLYTLGLSRLQNTLAQPPGGIYTDLDFEKMPNSTFARSLVDFRIKHLPYFGAYGFFTPKHGETSYILCPIHVGKTKRAKPVVTATPLALGVQIAITSTEPYDCYRLEFIQEAVCKEYVIYAERDYSVDVTYDVPLNGDVILRVTGYKNEISIYSVTHEEVITIVGTVE